MSSNYLDIPEKNSNDKNDDDNRFVYILSL